MGREIRKVPLSWKHPKEYKWGRNGLEEVFKPLYESSFSQAANEWTDGMRLWLQGEHPQQKEVDCPVFYWEYEGRPPLREDYFPEWPEEEKTGFCLYETVSEGTPVSPVFESLELLAEYLAEHGDFWDQKRGNPGWGIERATAFCKIGWAPSMVMIGGQAGLIEGKLLSP